jgi:hypothetical protein
MFSMWFCTLHQTLTPYDCCRNLVAVLLKAHADPTIANEAGETPASSAALALLTTINPVERAALENIRVKCSGQVIIPSSLVVPGQVIAKNVS